MSYLNVAADNYESVLLNHTPEFAELLAISAEFGLKVDNPPTCVARNLVVRGLRFNVLDWAGPADGDSKPTLFKIGRASCRERV